MMKTASITEAKVPPILETISAEIRVNEMFCPELPEEMKRNNNAIIGKPIHRKTMTLDL
jgi:hypothetical protein